MQQYGGMIPFSKMKAGSGKGTSKGKGTGKRKRSVYTRNRRRYSKKQKGCKSILNPNNYLPRTILRIKGDLYQLNAHKVWKRIE